ncbi:hypothetical protein IFM89_034334 [Coptis chinensis]|uniref:Endoglucanase n=1 Tax=Coptis chinensis TaxID=261450 RepID=A0A835M2G0_9MAGN|nr:hypothetical protein IFM89_034334 [Coptis chinensis]
MGLSSFSLVLLVLGVVIFKGTSQQVRPNYADALSKSILFFEGQRSGVLPSSQRMTWRKDSALYDGHDVGVDLTGGYYDAGDNVKFNFPMAFTTTVLAWSAVEFASSMDPVELGHTIEAVRWATDYFLKATSIQNKVFVQVGDPYSDHACWQRPEDMDTKRTAYAVTSTNPGSETNTVDPTVRVFRFALFIVILAVIRYDCIQDELLWAAAWLFKASNQQKYWDYVANNFNSLTEVREFGWDDKHGGIYVFMANELLSKGNNDNVYLQHADRFVCSIVPESPTKGVTYSPGGLIVKPVGSNMQNPTAISFLLLVYSRYLSRANKVVQCGDKIANPQRLQEIAKGQVDYILGNNPMKMSYMVGYGSRFPEKIHHRGSSLPSVVVHPTHYRCQDGHLFFLSKYPNPNELTGAVVGGPLPNDTYIDSREDFRQSEPTTYINAPLVGLLAYFSNPQI